MGEKLKFFQLMVGDNLHRFSRGNMGVKSANRKVSRNPRSGT
jgi:hypothetical protein